MFNKDDFRECMKTKQYHLSDTDEWIASCYGDKLTYNEVIELRLIALRKTLIKYNIEVITDLPWGKGLVEFRNEWKKLMTEAIKNR